MEHAPFWDREKILTTASIAGASYVWIVSESMLIAIAVGCALAALFTTLYEIGAQRYGMRRMRQTEFFFSSILPYLQALFARLRRA